MKQKLPNEFLTKLKAVTDKRPKTVIQHILKYGYVTTDELREKFGYKHPPPRSTRCPRTRNPTGHFLCEGREWTAHRCLPFR